MRTLAKYTCFAASLAAGITAAIGAAHAGGRKDDVDRLDVQAQVAELEQQIHVTFHAAVSVHDPVNGDSAAVITQRIRDILAIWAEDGELTIVNSTATAGNYIGNGDPMIPQLALHPRATRLPPGNRVRCARSTSTLAAHSGQPISLSHFPHHTKRSLFL